MIYFDNAATTWPKPVEVKNAVADFWDQYGANPGRGSYMMALKTARLVFEARAALADFFHADKPERIVFTANATEAINLALKGFLKPGDHVIYSSLEHNAVYRPLKALEKQGVQLTMVQTEPNGWVDMENILSAIRKNTKLLVVTHISNVTGAILPVTELGEIARQNKIRMLVDCAQSAGYLDIDVEKDGIDMLAFPGHKGLFGPTGTGGLYIREGVELLPLKEGGTGSKSHSVEQPELLPDKFESGTLNTMGIAGLKAGIEFIRSQGLEQIQGHEWELTRRFLKGVSVIPGVKIYGPKPGIFRAPVVSLNIKNADPGEVCFLLDKIYGIAVRSGAHCAPLAHETIGTGRQGTARFSFGFFNTVEEIDTGLKAIEEIAQELEN